MNNSLNQSVMILRDLYEAVEEGQDCEHPGASRIATLIDQKIGELDQVLTGTQFTPNEEFQSDLTKMLCRGTSNAFKFSLSDGSIVVVDPAWESIELLSEVPETQKKWNQIQNELGRTKNVGSIDNPNADAEDVASDLDDWETSDAPALPPGWDEDPLMQESVLPPFYLPLHYDGVQPVYMTMLLGHPQRPVLLMPAKAEPARVALVQGDTWPIYAWPSDIIIWWQDSPDEEYNEAALRALERIGAEETETIMVGGEERTIYQLPDPWRSGLIDDDHPVLEAFLEEEQKIDDDLSYVPPIEEIEQEYDISELPEEPLEYGKTPALKSVPYRKEKSVDPEDYDFWKPQLRLVDGVGYDTVKRRRK